MSKTFDTGKWWWQRCSLNAYLVSCDDGRRFYVCSETCATNAVEELNKVGEQPMFDNFEIHKVGEYLDHRGATFYETMDGISPDDGLLREFWTIYGHYSKPKHGVEALMDFSNEQRAMEIYDFLMTLMETFKTAKGVE